MLKAFDLIHMVVHKMCDHAPRVREGMVVRVLTEEGDIFDITDATVEINGNVLWLKVEVAE